MNGNLITAIILLLVIGYQVVFIFMQKRDFSRREQDLLNRIMSRNFETYIQSEEVRKPSRPLTPEEIYDMERERGIPI